MGELLAIRLGPIPAIAALALCGLAVLHFVLRRLAPSHNWHSGLTAPRRSSRTDLAYLLLAPLTETLSRTLTTLGVVGCALVAGKQLDPQLLEGFGPVVQQPRWLVVAEMLVLSDFIYYWTHRAAHALPWLWRLHAVHHSSAHLRWTSALRAHPAEAYAHLVNTLPLFLLGFPIDALMPMAPFVTLYACAIHTGVDVSWRRLAYVINTPVFHGVHHALDVSGGTKNYAGLLPLFDVLFGTYHRPERVPAQLGIDDAHMPDTLLGQLAYPFQGGDTEPEDSTDLGPVLAR
jgi:sterol desaturase/sphingolipid hydroxylase (fatty acid hydroxylase superfamily)